jgi:hypothetical protein
VLARLDELKPSRRERRKFGKTFGDDQNYTDTIASSILAYPDWRTRLRFARLLFFPDPAYMLQRTDAPARSGCPGCTSTAWHHVPTSKRSCCLQKKGCSLRHGKISPQLPIAEYPLTTNPPHFPIP